MYILKLWFLTSVIDLLVKAYQLDRKYLYEIRAHKINPKLSLKVFHLIKRRASV